jgi:uridine phosphorylase
MSNNAKYHIGFGQDDLGNPAPTLALLCGDPQRAWRIAHETPGVVCEQTLSEHRGLNSYLITLPGGQRIISATSGMGAPSTSIVVNELVDVGIRHIIRIGTSGSIQEDVQAGSVVISRAALCRQGAAADIAPVEYPAAANPFLTVALVNAARALGVAWHVGVTASVDTFYEGQERVDSSVNKHLLRWLVGINEEYRHLNILNYEMETGTLFKMGGVYGFAAGCVCAVVAERTANEHISPAVRKQAEENAIRVALHAAGELDAEYRQPRYWR